MFEFWMWNSRRYTRILSAFICKIQISLPKKKFTFLFSSCDKFRSRLGSIILPSWMNCIRQVFYIFVDSGCILMFLFSFLPKRARDATELVFFRFFYYLFHLHSHPFRRFDELHYGKYVSLYMRNIFFFEKHPPLGKQLIAGVASMAGYDGNFTFSKIGSEYTTASYFTCIDTRDPFKLLKQAFSSLFSGFSFANEIHRISHRWHRTECTHLLAEIHASIIWKSSRARHIQSSASAETQPMDLGDGWIADNSR